MSIEQLEREFGDQIRESLRYQMPRLESDAEAFAHTTGWQASERGSASLTPAASKARSVELHNGPKPMREHRRLVGWAAAGIAAAGIVALGGVIASRSPGSTQEPPASADGPTSTATPVVEEWPDELDSLLAPLLPDGFVPIHSSVSPPIAVAYNQDGVRIEVFVDVDARSLPNEGVSPEVVLSPEGDWVTGSVIYDYDVLGLDAGSVAGTNTPQSYLDAQSALPDILNAVADQFAGQERQDILAATNPVIDSADLRAAVDAAGRERLGTQLSNRALGAADFAFTYAHDRIAYTIAVIRAVDPLPEGVTQPSPVATTGRAWANGWQLIVTSTATGAGDALDQTDMLELVDAIRPLLAAWQPRIATVDTCVTHIVESGDSISKLSQDYGISMDELRAANPDFDVNMLLGATIRIPC